MFFNPFYKMSEDCELAWYFFNRTECIRILETIDEGIKITEDTTTGDYVNWNVFWSYFNRTFNTRNNKRLKLKDKRDLKTKEYKLMSRAFYKEYRTMLLIHRDNPERNLREGCAKSQLDCVELTLISHIGTTNKNFIRYCS